MARLMWLAFALFIGVAVSLEPVLLFPGYSLSNMQVTVTNGQLPGCPTSGTFTVGFTMDKTQGSFSEECMMNFLNLTYNPSAQPPNQFSSRPDVSVTIVGRETGDVACLASDTYQGMIDYFTAKGYTTGTTSSTFMAACFDWRMDPSNDVIAGPGFMNNTAALVEKLYANAGNQKVWLIGHSNGPIMQLYFLTKVSNEWKQKYIAGFLPLSGNFAGQGLFPVVYAFGLSVADFGLNPALANVHRFWSADYMSGPQPDVFTGANSLTFFRTQTPARSYNVTVTDLNDFFTSIGNTFGRQYWQNWAGMVGPNTPPGIYTYAIWGANIPTLVGFEVDNFANLNITQEFYLPGDVNQEYIDNESCKKWATTMPEGCFDFFEIDNVDHFAMCSDSTVMDKLWGVISQGAPSRDCTGASTTTSSDAATSSVLSVFALICALLVLF